MGHASTVLCCPCMTQQVDMRITLSHTSGNCCGEVRTVVSARRNVDGPRDGVRRALRGRAAISHALLRTQSSYDSRKTGADGVSC